MHVTTCLAGEKVDVEVGKECRSLQALREAIVEALPKLCVEGFDVCVGGRALDDDEGVVSLQDGLSLDVVPNTRGLSVRALREAGREVSEGGLLRAAILGDVSLVTLYLDAGVPIDCVGAFGETPLHMSCLHGHLSVVRLLLDRGSTAIDAKKAGGGTPLHLACHSGVLKIATLLLDRGSAAIDEKDDCRLTPLHVACSEGKLEVARLLLDRGSVAIDEKTRSDCTPLHLACASGSAEIATLLLDRGSTSIDEKCVSLETPLHLACCRGHVEIARLLLDRGTTAIDEKDRHGWTPLHDSCERKSLELVTLLLDRGSTAIEEKCRHGLSTPQNLARGHVELTKLLQERLTEKAQTRRFPAEATDGAAPESTKRRRVGEE